MTLLVGVDLHEDSGKEWVQSTRLRVQLGNLRCHAYPLSASSQQVG